MRILQTIHAIGEVIASVGEVFQIFATSHCVPAHEGACRYPRLETLQWLELCLIDYMYLTRCNRYITKESSFVLLDQRESEYQSISSIK